MLQKAIYRFTAHRHPWRKMNFDELGEVYASVVLRTTGIGLFGIFIPIYLYKIGYTLNTIISFFVLYFIFRCIYDIISGYLVARFGPKHIIALSTVFLIIGLILVLTLIELDWPLWLIALFWSGSISMYFVAFNTDFSKIKHKDHGGKELGFVIIFERIGGILGPLIGGLLATLFDARYSISLAIIVLLASLVPFFLTAEPVKQHQKLIFKGLDLRKQKDNLLAMSAFSVENAASLIIWPLLIGVVVFKSSTYAVIGLLVSLGMVFTLTFTFLIGRMIDKKHGGELLKVGVVINACLHFLRPFSLTPLSASVVSVANDPVTVAYRMPLIKGLFDLTDDLPGYRIAYITINELVATFSRLVMWIILWLMAQIVSPETAMQWIYIAVGLYSLLMLKQKFPSLKAEENNG